MTHADSTPAYYTNSELKNSDTDKAARNKRHRTKVLIVTDNTEAIKTTVMELRNLDLDVQLSLYDGHKLASIPNECPDAILCYFTDFIERSKAVVKSLKAHYAPRDIPVIGAAARATKVSTSHFDSMLFAPMHSSQIANRVRSIIRLGQMEAEITRRNQTITEDFGYESQLPDSLEQRKFQILFIGKAAPAFMVVINALQEKNVNVVAAFTSFTAFDYLHEDRFDAVVMNALEHPEPALSISETMRRNSALYHIPTFFLVDSKSFAHKDKAYESGASDIISSNAPLEEIRGRILELANYYRIHEQLKAEFNALGGPKCLDEPTKLFNADFFAAHMPRIKQAAKSSLKNYTTIAISLRANSVDEVKPAFMRSAFSQTGLMIKNLVRMQDIVARIDENLFAITMPDTHRDNTGAVMARIKDVIEAAAFDSGIKTNAAFTISIDMKILEPVGYVDGEAVARHITDEFRHSSQATKASA